MDFFVRFLEELRISKSPFEINWPLDEVEIWNFAKNLQMRQSKPKVLWRPKIKHDMENHSVPLIFLLKERGRVLLHKMTSSFQCSRTVMFSILHKACETELLFNCYEWNSFLIHTKMTKFWVMWNFFLSFQQSDIPKRCQKGIWSLVLTKI